MGDKSRTHWYFGMSDEQYKEIFKKATSKKIATAKARKDKCTRGDFKYLRECDKAIIDYKRFKGKGDREKIKNEYFGIQKEYRNNKVDGKVRLFPELHKEER